MSGQTQNGNNALLKATTTRRNFLKVSASAAGGLSLSLSLPGCSVLDKKGLDDAGRWQANAWLEISPDSRVSFTLDRVEMGQGTYTGLTTLLAEELDVPPVQIKVVFAPVATVYRNPDYGMQLTGGSNSLSSSWQQIREAGASVRMMLLAAAAEALQVPVSDLKTDRGFVVHEGRAKRLNYGSLAKLASKQAVPANPALKKPSEYRYIGKLNKRLDSHLKVTGSAVYGIDINEQTPGVDGLRYAVVSRSPWIGGRIKRHNGQALEGKFGVEKVVNISSGVAIVAKRYWQARKAQEKLTIEWLRENDQPINTEAVFDFYRQQGKADEGDSVRSEGHIDSAIENAHKVLEVEYRAPFLAHATMEPMNCTAHVRQDRADIWTSTQAPDLARVVVAKVSDVSLSDVHIHNQFIGGGFGRRLTQDFVGEAAEISYLAGGAIKLVWSREEDTQNDFYRPATLHTLRAALDENGRPIGWDHQIISPKIIDWYVWDAAPAMFPWAPKFMYSMLGHTGLMTEGTPITPADTSAYEGAQDLPYSIPAIEVRHTKADAGVPISYWRSVGHSHNAFVVEGFIDELAHEAGQDSYQFRRSMLASSPRLRNVLDRVATQGQWGRQMESGVFQGIAAHKSFGSYVAELVEIKIEHGEIRVLKVVCAVDCGLVVNPDIVTMQMESGIIFGITAALYGEITIEDGHIQQSNFDDYRLLRMNQSPEIETIIVDSEAHPRGVGEPGVPPAAPAIANALFKATGKRHRRLPLKLS